VKNSHVYLGDVGITGNGHMMMLEKEQSGHRKRFMASWLQEKRRAEADR